MKRLTILTGHYGSGKSEIAVNLAIQEKCDMLIDLDIINPYFRSRSVRKLLESHGVELVESTLENAAGSDLPFINAKGSRPFIDGRTRAIYDLGGTQHGAKLLKQYGPYLHKELELDLLLVVNRYRPDTATAEQVLDLIDQLESAGGVRITGLINNTNMLEETDMRMIFRGETLLKEVARARQLPIVYTCVEASVDAPRQFAGSRLRLVRYLAQHWL